LFACQGGNAIFNQRKEKAHFDLTSAVNVVLLIVQKQSTKGHAMQFPIINVEIWACDGQLYKSLDGLVPASAWEYYGTWTYQSCIANKPTNAIIKVLKEDGKIIREKHVD